jgi:hypothetical protein
VISKEEQLGQKAAASSDRAAVIAEEQLRHVQLLNSAIEDIFLFTLNKFSVLGGPHNQLVYLSSLAEIIGTLSPKFPVFSNRHLTHNVKLKLYLFTVPNLFRSAQADLDRFAHIGAGVI